MVIQDSNFDIIIGGAGPAGIGYAHALFQFIENRSKFVKTYAPYLPLEVSTKLKDNTFDPSICLIKGTRPNNQFVACWEAPYDELKPFGIKLADFAQHRTKILEWEFPTTKIRYESPYCSINHLKLLETLEARFSDKITIINDKIKDIHPDSDSVAISLSNGSKIASKIFVDACGYQSILNDKYNCNNQSPIYQMLVWKYPTINGYDTSVNNIWYKPRELYHNGLFDLNDRVAGWFHPVSDGVIIGASKYLFKPIKPQTLTKMLTPYLEAYIKTRKLVPEGEREGYQGIGVLYHPHHQLKINHILQIGDARRFSRPATGYGFVPGFWNGLFATIATYFALSNNNYTWHALDGMTKSLFDYNYKLNYTWGHIIQECYMKGDWSLVEFIFSFLKRIQPFLQPHFFDRLTMSKITRYDGETSMPYFLGGLLLNNKAFRLIPTNTKIDSFFHLIGFTKHLLSLKYCER
jgi:flavin-dependent dehydrogenase